MSHMHIGLSGRYTLEKRNAAGEVVQTLEFDNLITDAGLERWGTGGVIDRCYLGSGTKLPEVTDTALASPLGSTTTTTTEPANTTDAASVSYTVFYKWRFAPGVCTGDIREVGAGWATGLWSRALAVDGQGNPVTIAKAADESLDVTYAIKIQFPMVDIVGALTFKDPASGNDVAYACTSRASNLLAPRYSSAVFGAAPGAMVGPSYNGYSRASARTGGLTVVTSSPSGSLGAADSSAIAYVAGSKYKDLKFTFGLDVGNETIRSINTSWYSGSFDTAFSFQTEFNPPIVKNNTQILNIVARISWGRA